MSNTALQTAGLAVPKVQLWTGRVLTILTALFMLLDASMKFVNPPQVVEASQRIGFPVHLNPVLGVILLASTVLYVIPRAAVLGAVLLTGYLGGAVAINMRAGSSVFETLFPVIFGVIGWAGILLRDPLLRRHFPVRSLL